MERESKNIVFLHVEKAGGSTLHNILANYFDPDSVIHLEYMSSGQAELANLDPNRIKLIKGHVTFEIDPYLSDKWKYYSILREPVERVISYYFYVKQKESHHHSALIKKTNWSIGEYILKAENLQMDNGQVRYISGSQKPFGKINEEDLALAIKNIESRFLTVGLTEKFDESLLILKNLLEWEKIPVYERANVNRNKEKNISESEMKILMSMNKYDIALYDFVKNRFGREVSPDILKSDMARLKRATKKYYFKKGIRKLFSSSKQ